MAHVVHARHDEMGPLDRVGLEKLVDLERFKERALRAYEAALKRKRAPEEEGGEDESPDEEPRAANLPAQDGDEQPPAA